MIATTWKEAFFNSIQHYENASLFRQAAQDENLSDWTKYLTGAVVQTCRALGWHAAAKGHELDLLPIPHSEYLTLDAVAFAESNGRKWPFPVAVMELENSSDDKRIAYSLWKVLCVKSDLRIIFCYRRSSKEGSSLVKYLSQDIIKGMPLKDRMSLCGEILVAVGSRNDSTTFPYGFFKWWQLDNNTGNFNVI
jgi:hypothetical protein